MQWLPDTYMYMHKRYEATTDQIFIHFGGNVNNQIGNVIYRIFHTNVLQWLLDGVLTYNSRVKRSSRSHELSRASHENVSSARTCEIT